MRGTTLPISAQLVRPVAHDDRWHHLFEISAGDAASDVGKKGCTSYTEVLQNYFTFKHHMNNRQTLIFQLSFDHLWWAVPNSSDVMEIPYDHPAYRARYAGRREGASFFIHSDPQGFTLIVRARLGVDVLRWQKGGRAKSNKGDDDVDHRNESRKMVESGEGNVVKMMVTILATLCHGGTFPTKDCGQCKMLTFSLDHGKVLLQYHYFPRPFI